MLPSNLRLRNNQLQRIAVLGLVNWVFQNADCLEQIITGLLSLIGEVRGIGNDLLGLRSELHILARLISILHGGLDSRDLAIFVKDLIDTGVKHVCATVDGGQTGESLRQLTKTVKRVDVWGFAVKGHGVDIETDPVDGLFHHSRCRDVIV